MINHPWVLGAMLVVAVGTALFTLWHNNENTNRNYSYDRNYSHNVDEDDSFSSLGIDFDDTERRKRGLNEQCTICLCRIKEGYRVLSCGHKFHKMCITSWLNNKRSCPVCRADVF